MNKLRLKFLIISGMCLCRKIQKVAEEEKYLYLENTKESRMSSIFIANNFSATLFTALMNRRITFTPDITEGG